MCLTLGALLVSLSGCANEEGATDYQGEPPVVPTQEATFSTAEIEQALQVILDAGAPAVLAEVRNGGEVWRHSLGVTTLNGEQPVDELAKVRIASVTKTTMGIVLEQLVAEKKLDLDAPVTDYLPDLRLGREVIQDGENERLALPSQTGYATPMPVPPPGGLTAQVPEGAKVGDDVAFGPGKTPMINPAEKVTVRMLAQHMSGIPDYIETFPFSDIQQMKTAFGREYNKADIAARVADREWKGMPGETFFYSNTNYILLSMLIETITEKDIEEVLAERVFTPAGLEQTSLPYTDEMPEGGAHGYFQVSGVSVDVTTQPASLFSGAGGVVSTTQDVNSLYRGLMQGTYLPPERLQEMLHLNSEGYGIGIQGHEDPCTTQPKVIVPRDEPEALRPGESRPAPTDGAVQTEPASTTAAPSASASPTNTDRQANRDEKSPAPLLQIGKPGMAYGHLGSGLGYRIVAFSSPDGQRQVTIAWTVSPPDYGKDPRLQPAYDALDVAFAAICPAQ